MTIGQAFQDGGWGMYPVLVFGAAMVGSALWYAARPEGRKVPLLASMGILTLLSGLLGFTVGVINTLRFAVAQPVAEQHTITLTGVGESLNDVALSLVLMTLSTLIAAVGAFRLARKAAEAAALKA